MALLGGVICCLGAAAISLLGSSCLRDAEFLKTVTRVYSLNDLAQMLDLKSRERSRRPLIVAISARVGSETPISCRYSKTDLRAVIVEETAEQKFLKQDYKGSWIRHSEWKLPTREEVPWYLDDGTGRVYVVGALKASDFALSVGSEVFEHSLGLDCRQRQSCHHFLCAEKEKDCKHCPKMLGLQRYERVLPMGTTLTVVGEAVKDDNGAIRIRAPFLFHGEYGIRQPFYVSRKTIDQLISDFGDQARDAKFLKTVTRVNSLNDLAQMLDLKTRERSRRPLIVTISGRVGSETPIKCRYSKTDLRAVIVHETAEQKFLKQDDKGSWITHSELMLSTRNEVPWCFYGTGRVHVVGAQNASGFALSIGSEVFEQSLGSDCTHCPKMLGIKRYERVLPMGTTLTVVGEAVKDDNGAMRIRAPFLFHGEHRIQQPFYVSRKTIDQLISDLGDLASTIRRISSRQPTPNSSPAKLHAPRNNPSFPSNSVSSPIRTLDHTKPKVTTLQRPKHKQGSELVPIKFDYTTTSPNGSSQAPLARMAHQAKTAKPPSTGMVQPGKPTSGVASRIGPDQNSGQSASSKGNNGQIQVQFERNQANNKEESAGKKPTHYDDTFTAFIHRTKKRMSHDQEHGENNSAKGDGNHGHGHHKDHHFSDFIDKTKRKIRTTSSLKDRSESFFK
ncbi:E3 Ubiquitin ligase [Corchorus capsularis]|uniref:RING-type E3 ubiquitin transferase n=1 Tax=Corchorus capsularis TaxID=210143 RepID=A0A1R3I5A3_COCAP|nr:E3 Ubiquitin ligase [Corchorus capsularis]